MASGPPTEYSRGWDATAHVKRTTVDLSGYPGLIVMYLGMRVNNPLGVFTLMKFMRQVHRSVKAKPDGLLRHEPIAYSPRQVGMRQYWRDFESLEAWATAPPHRDWWRSYLEGTGGTGFWHETYFIGGGFEAIYDNIHRPIGLLTFAPHEPPIGGMFSARRRLERSAEARKGLPPAAEDGATAENARDGA